jgi:hypothetical protein
MSVKDIRNVVISSMHPPFIIEKQKKKNSLLPVDIVLE